MELTIDRWADSIQSYGHHEREVSFRLPPGAEYESIPKAGDRVVFTSNGKMRSTDVPAAAPTIEEKMQNRIEGLGPGMNPGEISGVVMEVRISRERYAMQNMLSVDLKVAIV